MIQQSQPENKSLATLNANEPRVNDTFTSFSSKPMKRIAAATHYAPLYTISFRYLDSRLLDNLINRISLSSRRCMTELNRFALTIAERWKSKGGDKSTQQPRRTRLNGRIRWCVSLTATCSGEVARSPEMGASAAGFPEINLSWGTGCNVLPIGAVITLSVFVGSANGRVAGKLDRSGRPAENQHAIARRIFTRDRPQHFCPETHPNPRDSVCSTANITSGCHEGKRVTKTRGGNVTRISRDYPGLK